ncbi:hypothetical protein [Actinacidiphila sp. bgisy167]|uniref:hypothetical protein n=1 Tax=Actinacidiphila sp. bgisy167 TaxID=3413797 RepID=UPI003D71F54C
MTTPRRFRIEASEHAPLGAAPETAAVRLIALLPPQWKASIVECTARAAVIAVTSPASPAQGDVDQVVEEIVCRPALAGWTICAI